jgi:hypothetical protein
MQLNMVLGFMMTLDILQLYNTGKVMSTLFGTDDTHT